MQVNSERAIENARRWGVRNNFHWLKLIRLQQEANRLKIEEALGQQSENTAASQTAR